MISNLRHQLRKVGMEANSTRRWKKPCRVRAEFGYPIMVTPLSQFVGSQAAINVIVGERYKEVTDQVIQYALGHCGEEAATAMDPDVKDKILDRPRAKEITAAERPAPTLEDMRRELDAARISDEELLLRWLLNKEDIAAMRAAGPAKEYNTARHPLVQLMAEITQRSSSNLIHVSKPGFSLSLERKRAEQ